MQIDSPPYPKFSCNPANLFKSLCELHEWVSEQWDWANLEATRLHAPDSPFVPKLGLKPGAQGVERFNHLAVSDMYSSWRALRGVRERFDDLVRNFETDEEWESDASIYHRITVAKAAAMLLTVAFLDHEKREAKDMAEENKMRKAFFKKIRSVLVDTTDIEAESERLEEDNWFN